MKKIFFIMSTNDYSGAEAVNFSIIDNLKDQYDFYWVSKKGKINNFLHEKGIKWIEIKKLSVPEIKKIIKNYKPDILHATDYRSSVICSLANKNKPLLLHVHNNGLWLKKLNFYSLSFLYAGIKCKKIITVSPSIENEYIFRSFFKNKFVCLGNPFSNKNIIQKVNNKDYNKKYDICCTARLTEAKNPLRFLEILCEIKKKKKDIKAIWIGTGENEVEFLQKIKELDLEENIKLAGFQKNPYKIMASSKIFLLTSKWEGFGLSALEALSLGLPAIVSNVGGLPYIINNKCGLICNSNKEFINEIVKLLTNNAYYEEKRICALKRAKELSNYPEYFNSIAKLYEGE